jgi:hypothetical protein
LEVLGAAVAEDEPLMAAGLDSLGSVELRNTLESRLGLRLPPTLVSASVPKPCMCSLFGDRCCLLVLLLYNSLFPVMQTYNAGPSRSSSYRNCG